MGGSGNDTLISDGGADILIAGTGANTLTSTGYGNTLIGGAGTATLIDSGASNTLVAGSGSTIMINQSAQQGATEYFDYSKGAGSAIIKIESGSPGTSNELDFGSGITDESLWFVRSGNDLRIDILGTNEQITVSNWFSSPSNQLSEITAGGMKLDSQVAQLVQAMATYTSNNSGFNPATATQMPNDPTLQNAIGRSWHS
jgi:hypothetical protein